MDHLSDGVDVVPPSGKGFEGLGDVGTSAFDDKASVAAKNVRELEM